MLAISLLAVVAAACGSTSSSSSSSSSGLASSQVLKFPAFQNPGTWDPGEADAEVDTEFMQNVFDNLWRFDNNLNIVPDIATAVPTSSQRGDLQRWPDLHRAPQPERHLQQRRQGDG